MEFKLTVADPDGSNKMAQWEDLDGMRAELGQLALVLDALVVGQVVTLTRLS